MSPPRPASRMLHSPSPPQPVPEAASASRPLTHPRAIQECGEVLFLWEWTPRAAKGAGLVGFLPALLPYPVLLMLAPHTVSSHTLSPSCLGRGQRTPSVCTQQLVPGAHLHSVTVIGHVSPVIHHAQGTPCRRPDGSTHEVLQSTDTHPQRQATCVLLSLGPQHPHSKHRVACELPAHAH